ncbi:MobQ family relaxase [Carnobacterium maltaromaticum]|uniref:MobQ family relaxase n=1 Tax=Carnobacterium maltaromaticum TaxID=2751 RepID=UPI000C77CF6A|nr:MobQ family relaxase [Carnobacterium maltaromaticum]PLS40617.1 molybdopterin-guanine dinucleotide biosynthesis protein MobA [Carnobacterium maltaromaticum]PLS41105.1 molybdopterin-guanine dinucleotide biosynthesis protein MobA [Carnobacterium maltaromaticum]
MAIYHCSVKIGSRSNGASSVGSCAYRESVKIKDERLGIEHDYSRKSGVIESFTMTPENAPTWASDSAKLWNEVERIEKRKDAQVFREVVVALPRELDREKQQQLVTDYTKRNFVDEGMCATVAIHETEHQNPHAHIMLTTRTISEDGFGKKQRDWNQKNRLESWRSDWSQSVNQALQRDGLAVRVDHRSLEQQGISRVPQIHMGKAATAMERKGIETERGDRNREITTSNQDMARFIQQGINSARKQFEAHKAQEAARKAEALVLQQQREREAKAQEMERRQKEALERSSKQKSQGRGWSL